MSLSQKESPSTGLAYWSNSLDETPERLVLCLPGRGAPGSDFLTLIEALAPHNPKDLYIAPDLPGTGKSPASLCPDPTVAGFIELLNKLCEEVLPSSNNLLLIGHSLGCRLALELFSQDPNRVPAVVLLEGSWGGPKALTRAEIPPSNSIPRELLLKLLDSMFGPHTETAFKEKHRQIVQVQDLDYLTELTLSSRKWDAERMTEVLQQFKSLHESDHRVPLLLVQSMDSAGGVERRPLKKGEENAWMKLARENAGDAYSSLVVEECSHWPQVDKTDKVAQAILRLVPTS